MAIDWEWFQKLINGTYDQDSLWGPQVSSADALPGQGYGAAEQWPGLDNNLLLGMNNPDSSVGDLAASQQMQNGMFKNKSGKGGFHYKFNLGSLMSGS